MKTSIFVLILALALPAGAGVSAVDREWNGFITPEFREALSQIRQALATRASVSMRISSGSGAFYDIRESALRINLSGSKDSNNYFHFSGSADNHFLSLTASPYSSQDPSRGYSLWGAGVNLSINPSGSNYYYVSGSLDGKNFHLSISRSGDSYYSILGQGGVSLSANSFGRDLAVSGSVDLAQFGKKALAVLGTALAVVDSSKAPPNSPRK